MPKAAPKEPLISLQRINRAFDFIDRNLDRPLTLEKVAEASYFSPFHFHRIFKFLTGETLNDFITRQRIEKSALDLLHQHHEIGTLAAKYGYSESSSYSRAFKSFYGMSPTAFRREHPYRHSKIRPLYSKNGQKYPERSQYITIFKQLFNWITMNATIEIKQLPKMELAYVSCIGSQNIGLAYSKLIQWATNQHMMNDQSKMVTIYHDSFKVTEPQKVRMSASILLEKSLIENHEIDTTTIESGRYLVGHFQIGVSDFEQSWTGLFLWMNEQGYKKADREVFEIYHNNMNEHPEKKAIVDFCIPIQ